MLAKEQMLAPYKIYCSLILHFGGDSPPSILMGMYTKVAKRNHSIALSSRTPCATSNPKWTVNCSAYLGTARWPVRVHGPGKRTHRSEARWEINIGIKCYLFGVLSCLCLLKMHRAMWSFQSVSVASTGNWPVLRWRWWQGWSVSGFE